MQLVLQVCPAIIGWKDPISLLTPKYAVLASIADCLATAFTIDIPLLFMAFLNELTISSSNFWCLSEKFYNLWLSQCDS